MKKIVKGNDFTLRIPVMKMVEGKAQAFPLPACTDVVVQVCNQFRRIPLAFEIDVKEDNVLLARVEGDKMSLGTYAIEVKGKTKFNTKNVTHFGWCFEGASKLKWLDISGFDLSSATDTTSFFGRNTALTHLILGEGFGKVRTGITLDMSSFASLDEESKESFMTLYDRKANGLPNMTLKLKTSYGFTDEQVQSLTNKGYTINLV